MKRELGFLAEAVDVDIPRTKRRKELTGSTNHPTEAMNVTNDAENQVGGSSSTGQEGLKEQATKLWQMVKDAVNKEWVTKPELSAASLVPLSVLVLIMTEILLLFQWQHMLTAVHALAVETPLSRLLRCHCTTYMFGRHQEEDR